MIIIDVIAFTRNTVLSSSQVQRKYLLDRILKKALAMKGSGKRMSQIKKELSLDLLSTGACWHTRRDYLNVTLSRLELQM